MPNTSKKYDYDLVVIGGGSGGLAASKEAADLGAKVAVCDFVVPTPLGTTWGLGGTCVNVGCIPKKLMHQAALLGLAIKDSKIYGWRCEKGPHDWPKLVETVKSHVAKLNWGYRVALRNKKVNYLNAYASLVDAHTVKTVDKRGNEKTITADKIILATGLRPRYPDIPGAKEYGVTSDDIFYMSQPPGDTLCVGASYVSLECAGFLREIGNKVTVMVRSILLRGFDQQMAELIGAHMQRLGIEFQRERVPVKIEKVSDTKPPQYRVTSVDTKGETRTDVYNTILFAIGRDACTKNIGLEKVGVKLNPKNGKVICNDHEQSSVKNIYAIGDILDGKLELTPVAIQAGIRLARRLFGNSKLTTDYDNVPTTVFSPLEYGCCGLSEEDAVARCGADNIEVFHSFFTPLEFEGAGRNTNECYVKLVCLKTEENRVLGLHILAPNAGEVTQGYALGMKLGAKKSDFDDLIGIHPTVAEVFTTLSVTKRENVDPMASGC